MRADKPAAPTAAIALQFQVDRHWPGAAALVGHVRGRCSLKLNIPGTIRIDLLAIVD